MNRLSKQFVFFLVIWKPFCAKIIILPTNWFIENHEKKQTNKQLHDNYKFQSYKKKTKTTTTNNFNNWKKKTDTQEEFIFWMVEWFNQPKKNNEKERKCQEKWTLGINIMYNVYCILNRLSSMWPNNRAADCVCTN